MVIRSLGLQKFMIQEISRLDVVPLCLVVVNADTFRQSPSKTHEYHPFSTQTKGRGGLGTVPA